GLQRIGSLGQRGGGTVNSVCAAGGAPLEASPRVADLKLNVETLDAPNTSLYRERVGGTERLVDTPLGGSRDEQEAICRNYWVDYRSAGTCRWCLSRVGVATHGS